MQLITTLLPPHVRRYFNYFLLPSNGLLSASVCSCQWNKISDRMSFHAMHSPRKKKERFIGYEAIFVKWIFYVSRDYVKKKMNQRWWNGRCRAPFCWTHNARPSSKNRRKEKKCTAASARKWSWRRQKKPKKKLSRVVNCAALNTTYK